MLKSYGDERIYIEHVFGITTAILGLQELDLEHRNVRLKL